MELRQLNYFIAVVEDGTISGAARTLHMSQPPLTAQMHALEAELGCELFAHTGRRLRITEAGQALYERAKAITGLCDSTRAEMSDFRAGTAGVLHIGVISSVCGTGFLRWIREFAWLHPRAHYDLHEANTYQLLSRLRTRRIDVAIVRTPFAAPDMNVVTIEREPMLAVGEARFFSGMPGGSISCAALTAAPLMLYRRWETILRARFEQLGLSPDIVCVNDNAFTTLALARSGLGVALVPASALEGEPEPGIEIRTLDEGEMYSSIAAVYRAEGALPSLAQLFIDMLVHSGDSM